MEREKSNDENIYRFKIIVKPEELQFKSRTAGIDKIMRCGMIQKITEKE